MSAKQIKPGGKKRQSSLTQQTLSGLMWMFSGSGAQALLQFFVLMALARLVAPEEFGTVSAALVVISFLAIFARLGVGPAIVQRSELTPRHIRTAFTLSLLLSVLFATGVWWASPWIARFFQIEALTGVLPFFGLVFLFQGLSLVSDSLLQREMQFKRIVRIQVLSYLTYGLVGVTVGLLGHGLWALVSAYLSQSAVKAALSLWSMPHEKRLELNVEAARELLYFGGGHSLSKIFEQISLQGDNLVVGRTLGAEALGLYGRAYQLMMMPASLIGAVLDKVLFPAMAKVQGESKRLLNTYRRGLALIALVVLPVSSFLFFVAGEVVLIILGPGWTEMIVPFQVLTIGMLFRTSYKVSDSLVKAKGHVYKWAISKAVYAAAVMTGAWIGHFWGLTGVTVGVLAAITLNFVMMARLCAVITGLSWTEFVLVHRPAVLLALIVGAETWFCSSLLRLWFDASLLIVVLTALPVLLTVAVLWQSGSKKLWGAEGLWMKETLAQLFADKVAGSLKRR